jgi:hypothetical protein
MSGAPKRAEEAEEEEETGGGALPDVIQLPDLSQPPRKRPVPWRGRPRVADPHSVQMPHWRATPELAEQVLTAAADAGLSYGAFMRAKLSQDGNPGPRARRKRHLGLSKEAERLLAQILGGVGKLGSNHNQLSRERHITGAEPDPDEWRRIAADVREMRDALMKALGYGD